MGAGEGVIDQLAGLPKVGQQALDRTELACAHGFDQVFRNGDRRNRHAVMARPVHALVIAVNEAVLELEDPHRHAEGTTLTITLAHRHEDRTWIHNIGRLRLSITTSKPPFPFELQELTLDDLATFWTDLGSADDATAKQAAESLFQSGRAAWFLETLATGAEGFRLTK